jgi:acetolactate synthase-1/2/3 large subunit
MEAEVTAASPRQNAPSVVTTVAEAMAAAIASAGIDVAFSFPGGGSNLALIDALERAGVRVVLTRSEGGGAFIAAAYAELTGKPGVLIVGVGPGATSAVNGVAHAFLDRIPFLLVTDRYSPAEADSSGHQLIDHAHFFASISKWQKVVEPASAGALTVQALRISLTPPWGPVHLELPRDVALAPAEAPGEVTPDSHPDGLSGSSLESATALLEQARRPVILVGHEARAGVRQDCLVSVAERVRAPTWTTYKAKGLFPEAHPLSAGIITGAQIEQPVLARADAILGVGFDPIELLARAWSTNAPIVALRTDPREDRYLAPRWALVGEIGAALERIDHLLGETCSEWTSSEVEALATSMRDALRIPAPGSLASWQTIEAVQKESPGDTTVTVDAGAHMFAATWFWRSSRPGRFLISNGLSSMGFAVPAAIGASLVRPGETVIAFTGDGGFLLHGNELETAVRIGARVIVIVFNDSSLSLIRVKQEDLGYPRTGVDFRRCDLALFAEALGARGFRAESEAELRAAVREALAETTTTVIDVRLSGSEYREMHRLIRG